MPSEGSMCRDDAEAWCPGYRRHMSTTVREYWLRYDGSRPADLNKQIREKLGPYIVPSIFLHWWNYLERVVVSLGWGRKNVGELPLGSVESG